MNVCFEYFVLFDISYSVMLMERKQIIRVTTYCRIRLYRTLSAQEGFNKRKDKMTTPLPAQLEPLFTHQTAQVNGVRLHYVIGGQGFPVVLLHGWPQTWYEWRKIMPALAEKYTVIAPDSRGIGDSERTESGYDASTLAEDVFSLVRSLGFQQMFLVGHDTGSLPPMPVPRATGRRCSGS